MQWSVRPGCLQSFQLQGCRVLLLVNATVGPRARTCLQALISKKLATIGETLVPAWYDLKKA